MNSDSPVRAQGVVRAIDHGRALVAVAVRSGCASCGQSCGIGRLAGGGKTALLHLSAPPGLKAGDRVTLDTDAATMSRAALIGYLLPAFTLIVGAGLGETFAGGDLGAAFGALSGLAGGLALARRWAGRCGSAAIRLGQDGG